MSPATQRLAVTGLLMAADLWLGQPRPRANTSTNGSAKLQQQAAPPVDPSFSAWSLMQACKQKSDNVAEGQCVGAIRGIIHGYQYGVLFVGQRTSLPASETLRVFICFARRARLVHRR